MSKNTRSNKERAFAAGTAKRPLKQNSATTDAIHPNDNSPGSIGQAHSEAVKKMYSKKIHELNLCNWVWEKLAESLIDLSILLHNGRLPRRRDAEHTYACWHNLNVLIKELIVAVLEADGLLDPKKTKVKYSVDEAWEIFSKGFTGDNRVKYLVALDSLFDVWADSPSKETFQNVSEKIIGELSR